MAMRRRKRASTRLAKKTSTQKTLTSIFETTDTIDDTPRAPFSRKRNLEKDHDTFLSDSKKQHLDPEELPKAAHKALTQTKDSTNASLSSSTEPVASEFEGQHSTEEKSEKLLKSDPAASIAAVKSNALEIENECVDAKVEETKVEGKDKNIGLVSTVETVTTPELPKITESQLSSESLKCVSKEEKKVDIKEKSEINGVEIEAEAVTEDVSLNAEKAEAVAESFKRGLEDVELPKAKRQHADMDNAKKDIADIVLQKVPLAAGQSVKKNESDQLKESVKPTYDQLPHLPVPKAAILDERVTLSRLREALDTSLNFHKGKSQLLMFHKVQSMLSKSTDKNIGLCHVLKIIHITPTLYQIAPRVLTTFGVTTETFALDFGASWVVPLSGSDLESRKTILATEMDKFYKEHPQSLIPEAAIPRLTMIVDKDAWKNSAHLPPGQRALLESHERRRKEEEEKKNSPERSGSWENRALSLRERIKAKALAKKKL
ncbi:hypothetical protein DFQ29_005618 [Apophysomyces sp. BC1021]|nr:hypothetical protein DFQ29_005618 [Apophysomyces sp. BC1021]